MASVNSKADKKELFESMPVSKAIITLAVPTIISQIITVVYNIADTFFIGQMNDPNQVAAATLIMPPFLVLSAVANLFGIGGASLISRSMGMGDRDRARRCAAFSIWGSVAVAIVYGVLLYMLRPFILPLMGADEFTYEYCSLYLFWVITVGGIPTILSACLSHLVRAEGYAKEASFGIAMGGILNIILDPVLMFVFKLGLIGAAVATMFSNLCAMVYFIVLIVRNSKSVVIRFSPQYFTAGSGIAKEVVLVGLPSFLLMVMSTVSNLILNKLVVSYSNQYIAGMGIAKKIDMFAFAFNNGMTQGVLPLIGYNYAAKNYERMQKSSRLSFLYAFCLAAISSLLLFTCAAPLMHAFIKDSATVAFGQYFLRRICVTVPCTSVTMMVITMFQATGQKGRPLFLSLLRKGCLDVPLMFIMDSVGGIDAIPYATPAADILAMIIAVLFFLPYWRKFGKGNKE